VLIFSPGLSVFSCGLWETQMTPPSRAVFFLSVLLAVLALLMRYAISPFQL
jgi:hypothetical protein